MEEAPHARHQPLGLVVDAVFLGQPVDLDHGGAVAGAAAIGVVHAGSIGENLADAPAEQIRPCSPSRRTGSDSATTRRSVRSARRSGRRHAAALHDCEVVAAGREALDDRGALIGEVEQTLLERLQTILDQASVPLIIGVGEGEHFLASDASAIVSYTRTVVYLKDYDIVNDYRAFVTNEAAIVDLRKRYEALTGPVRNAGGVR